MRRRVAIVQSSYMPWRGTFAMIAGCDTFVFLDTVQFTRRDWRTRNRIKTPQGLLWLTVPVRQKGRYFSPIDVIEIASPSWAAKHLASLHGAYRAGVGYAELMPQLRELYAQVADVPALSGVNQMLMREVSGLLDLKATFVRDVDLLPREMLGDFEPTRRLVELAQAAGATSYISGPSARAYLDVTQFEDRGIDVEWMSYTGLQPYDQLWGPFEPAVSILDTLLTLGPGKTRESLGA